MIKKSKLFLELEKEVSRFIPGVSFGKIQIEINAAKWEPPDFIKKEDKRIAIYKPNEKLVLSSLHRVLYNSIDKKLTENCIGGRRGMGRGRFVYFLEQARNSGLYWILKTDVQDYFYSINHSKLEKILREKYRIPKDVLSIIFGIISSGCDEPGKGIFPGNPMGKLIGNVYLSLLDDYLINKKKFFVRYIDDVCVFCRTKKEAEETLKDIEIFLKEKLNLNISPGKTGIYHLYFEKFDFLGYEIIGNHIKPSKENINRFLDNINKLCKDYSRKGVRKFIRRINSVVYNFGHMYKIGSVNKIYQKLDEIVRANVRRWLKTSGKGKIINSEYKDPVRFPDNLSFSDKSLKEIGLCSLFEIKKNYDCKIKGTKNDFDGVNTSLKINQLMQKQPEYKISILKKEKFLVIKDGFIGILTNTPESNLQVGDPGDGTGAIANAWNVFSSIRWKKNVKEIDNALDKVMKLRGVYFDWKESSKHDIGLIAEEVGKIIPEVVEYEENKKDAKSVDYARLVSVLIEAVKEQQKEIEKLQLKVKELEKKEEEVRSEEIKESEK